MNSSLFHTVIYILTYWTIVSSFLYITFIIAKAILKDRLNVRYKTIHIAYLISLFVFAVLSTFIQREIWLSSDFTKIFASFPLRNDVPLPGFLIIFKPLFSLKYGYLIHYSLIHFFASIFWGVLSSFVLYYTLNFVSKKRPYLLNNDELNVILAGSLAVLWPNVVGYVVILFVIFLIHNVFNSLIGKQRTEIMTAAIMATVLMFILANYSNESHSILKDLYFVQPR